MIRPEFGVSPLATAAVIAMIPTSVLLITTLLNDSDKDKRRTTFMLSGAVVGSIGGAVVGDMFIPPESSNPFFNTLLGLSLGAVVGTLQS